MRALRRASATLAAFGLALALAPAASAQEAGEYDRFDRCPIDDPLMRSTEGVVNIACIRATTNGGSLQIGRTPIASTDGYPVDVQFGIVTFQGTGNVTVSQPNAVRATPVPVPGGLVGITGEANLKRLLGPAVVDAVNRVTATVEQAGPIANFEVTAVFGGTPVFDLPVKLHLEHPLLGPRCYIGSDENPIMLRPQTGPTDPPPPNEPITGDQGSLGSIIIPPENRVPGASNTFIIAQENARMVDNTFAVPKARNCGPLGLGLLDGVINQRQTLPQQPGANTVILDDTDSYVGLAGSSSELGLSAAEVMELLLAPGPYTP